ncbi:DUF4232 domain-containing protein [Frondihabitans sp. VKM Ac-2883]|uniref:DUF4232 domain-containing protein n=1 Tax=Frondihabitans sp. VKM Ac-2883 TaxID=2783823 RepID=UPI00351C7F1D
MPTSGTSTPGTGTSSTKAGTSTSTSSPGTRTSACAASQLAGGIGQRDGQPGGSGSGMSQQRLSVILTNTSSTACTLQGWPGVSFVGNNNGTQIGAAATLDRGTPHPTVTLRHGTSAQAYITIKDSAVFNSAECKPVQPDGFRVYPPGNKTSIFIKGAGAGDGTVCTSTKDDLLHVAAFIPNP